MGDRDGEQQQLMKLNEQMASMEQKWDGKAKAWFGDVLSGCRAVLGWLLIVAITLLVDGNVTRAQSPPVTWQPTGARITWRGLSFIVPPNMNGAAKSEFYEMGGLGITGTMGVCAIWIVGETSADGELATQAKNIFLANLAGVNLKVTDSRGGPNLIRERRVGRSADG